MLPLQELNGCITHSMQASQCMFTCNLEMQVGVRNSWIVYYITIAPVLLEHSMWKILLLTQAVSIVCSTWGILGRTVWTADKNSQAQYLTLERKIQGTTSVAPLHIVYHATQADDGELQSYAAADLADLLPAEKHSESIVTPADMHPCSQSRVCMMVLLSNLFNLFIWPSNSVWLFNCHSRQETNLPIYAFAKHLGPSYVTPRSWLGCTGARSFCWDSIGRYSRPI